MSLVNIIDNIDIFILCRYNIYVYLIQYVLILKLIHVFISRYITNIFT